MSGPRVSDLIWIQAVSHTDGTPERSFQKMILEKSADNKKAGKKITQEARVKTNEPVREISNNVVCATSKASDQPAHTHSLIRAFASCLSIL